VLSLRKPSVDALRRFRAGQSQLDFTYAAVGATFGSPPMPTGFAVDKARSQLGSGGAVFDRATSAMRCWRQFQLSWLEPWPADTPLRAGETIVVVARTFPVWWMNAARIVYVVDESTDSTSRYGFAYGTLPGHVEMGEERFLVEWDRATDAVWFDILAFSRPRHFLTRLARRQARRMQQRFRDESTAAMQRTVRT
jgi:uncharacterized protein (UPF0548 family)